MIGNFKPFLRLSVLKITLLNVKDIGVWAALASAFLFGAGTPLAKGLLGQVSPWLLAGLLYAGSGLGLLIYRLIKKLPTPRLNRSESLWLLASVVCGGGAAPVLLMFGLSSMAASHASLLLNAEAVLTTLFAWALFKEHLGRRIVLGMALIVAGALLLSWPASATNAEAQVTDFWPALAVVLACAFWALDNNFTRKVALNDASWIACIKGMSAGVTNLGLAFVMGAAMPPGLHISAAMLLGFLAYGVSLALFVVALRHLGASRTGAYFSMAPFVGALISVLLFAEPVSWQLLGASALMGLGVWLHLTEHHAHQHQHHAHSHAHLHMHDEHHLHDHAPGLDTTKPHVHMHDHEPLTHDHAHYPDAHHRHGHGH
jgi:drug/metabolite transporter (DMT)-like permease